ncbi:MAG TPA: hypothetical protein VNK07_00180 [Candidatus Binatia bacterium]|nr:hypothetical protein [Candidatus Binatia bacterium]
MRNLCLFIGLSVVIAVLALFATKDAVAVCTPDMLEDWPDTPCGPIQLPPEKQRDYWQGYYKFKGKEWMEEKRTEMENAILSDNLERWRSSMSNYNVWLYYKITSNIPEVPPLKQFKSGVPINEIKCKEGLELVYKKADDTSACVKTNTMIELVVRGWAEDNRVILGCTGDRVEKCYPSDAKEYRKVLYEYYFGKNADLPSGNFTKLQTINACTEHQICLGEFDNGTKIRVSCDYPVHGCGVVPFDELAMPDDFGIVYSFGVGGKNVLDTKKMSYKADMICEPQIEINLELSHDELYQIWDAVHKNGFFELNDFTDNCDMFGNCKQVTPEQQTTITITEGEKTHSVTHRDSYISKSNDGYAKFQKIVNTIQGILDKKPEIQSLPQLKCGYQ